MNELKLARPREVPMLRMAGYRPVMQWSDSFIMMQLVSRETKDSTADHSTEQGPEPTREMAGQP